MTTAPKLQVVPAADEPADPGDEIVQEVETKEPDIEPSVDDEPEVEAAPAPFAVPLTPKEAEERLKAASAEFARVEAAQDDLLAKRDGYEKELGELKAEHRRIAGDAIAGKTAAIKRIGEIVQRCARLETEALPTVTIAIEQAESILPARNALAAAKADIHHFKMLDAGRAVVSASRKADAAMEALSAALDTRDETIEQYAATARTQIGKELAHRLLTSSNLDLAWAWHALPGALEVPERDLKPLAELDAELLGLKED